MVVVKGNRELRSFAIVKAQKENGCATKFNENSRFVSATPVSAAQKAFSRLCNLKRIRGKCTLFLTIVDTTQGARTKGKTYTYRIDRKKLAKPIELAGRKIEYANKVKKAKSMPACKKSRKSSGRKASRSKSKRSQKN